MCRSSISFPPGLRVSSTFVHTLEKKSFFEGHITRSIHTQGCLCFMKRKEKQGNQFALFIKRHSILSTNFPLSLCMSHEERRSYSWTALLSIGLVDSSKNRETRCGSNAAWRLVALEAEVSRKPLSFFIMKKEMGKIQSEGLSKYEEIFPRGLSSHASLKCSMKREKALNFEEAFNAAWRDRKKKLLIKLEERLRDLISSFSSL